MRATPVQRELAVNAVIQFMSQTGNFLDTSDEITAMLKEAHDWTLAEVPKANPTGRTVDEIRQGLVITLEVCLKHLKRKLL